MTYVSARRLPRARRPIALLAASLMFSLAAVAAVRPSALAFFAPAQESESTPAQYPDDLTPRGTHRVVLVALTPNGFEPSEITVGPGAKRLVVENASGRADVAFAVRDADGNALVTRTLADGESSMELLPFLPGEMIVVDESQPDQPCRLLIVAP